MAPYLPLCEGESDFNILAKLSVRNRKRGEKRRRGKLALHKKAAAAPFEIPSLAFSKHLLGDKPARKCRKMLCPPQGGR
ncbi:hypothetical protein MPL1032_20797 [Mesorhizobium plurifarium]|uniref:Uncharacterized protein n=1 Tax=Mesorhizobium plurifarium TaxID=69974 RepID=A0A0K2VXZ3_MESPL|nr:hypothetical protein MPL1032_20797 [Mesorhizobium plurifarium]